MGRVRIGRRRKDPPEEIPEGVEPRRWRRLSAVAAALGRLRLTPALRARLGILTGAAMLAAGAGLAAGLAAGLSAGGASLIAYCLLLMDVGTAPAEPAETREESPW